jgi:hypothetical protein
MDRVDNPFQPGAGTQPPELVGRDGVRELVQTALARLRRGFAAKSVLILGLRGVGKTVLLERMRLDAEDRGICTIRLEAPENKSLPALLAPAIRQVLLRLSRLGSARDFAQRAMRALAGFVKLKAKYRDIEVSLDLDPEPGLADNGDLEVDLTALLEQVGLAARKAETAVVLFIDEVQWLAEAEFGALIAALHRCAQSSLPVTVVGAGLPQLRGLAGDAKSYAERLFEFPQVGPLTPEQAEIAIVRPAADLGVQFTPDAVQEIVRMTSGYPYFLQEWGKHAWDVAERSPITADDVRRATIESIAALDQSFFRVRFDRLTPTERRYLRAMAEIGPGPHRSGDIAKALGKPVQSQAPVRQKLINKGMIWSPSHGDTAFTVPLFDEFMKRILPGTDWLEA